MTGKKRAKPLPKGVLEARVETTVPVSRTVAWRMFTRGIRTWWPKGFGTRKGSRMVLEARPGGRMGEVYGRGAGLDWYRVAGVDPGHWLLMFGDIALDYGGPARSHLVVTFEEADGGGTRVLLREVLFAGGSRTLRKNVQEGWDALVAGAYAEACARAAKRPAKGARRKT